MHAAQHMTQRDPIALLRSCALAVFVLSSFVVFIEPSPYEATFSLALIIFLVTGMSLHAAISPMILALVVFNLGGLFSVMQVMHDTSAIIFMAVSAYLALQAVFFASLATDNTDHHLNIIRIGYAAAAVCASLAGIVGFLDIAGLGEKFTLYGRASGTFKDPNVLGTFLVPPAIFLFQDIVTGRRYPLIRTAAFGIIVFGIFLSFSRGAWANLLFAGMILVFGMWNKRTEPTIRLRIILAAVLGVFGLVAMILIALSIDEIREMLLQRASLNQSYDVGETGRFGRQLRALPELLERPLGYGPLQFRYFWPEDPHNVYINAFASYGWVGGIAYFGLALATLRLGWLMRTATGEIGRHAQAIWPPLLAVMLQGIQIDTDHWRHFFLLLGLMWGLYAAFVKNNNAAQPLRRAA